MDDSSEPTRPADEPLAPPPPVTDDDAVGIPAPDAPAVDTGRPSTGAIKVLSIPRGLLGEKKSSWAATIRKKRAVFELYPMKLRNSMSEFKPSTSRCDTRSAP